MRALLPSRCADEEPATAAGYAISVLSFSHTMHHEFNSVTTCLSCSYALQHHSARLDGIFEACAAAMRGPSQHTKREQVG